MPRQLEYDETAVRMIAHIETVLGRLNLPRYGHFVGILNAIENHVEEGDGVPAVVSYLSDALIALAAHQRLPATTIAGITRALDEVRVHVAKSSTRR